MKLNTSSAFETITKGGFIFTHPPLFLRKGGKTRKGAIYLFSVFTEISKGAHQKQKLIQGHSNQNYASDQEAFFIRLKANEKVEDVKCRSLSYNSNSV